MYEARIERSERVHLDWTDPENVKRSGIETPNGTRVIARAADSVTIKVPRGRHWTGIGSPPAYHPARVEVYVIVEPNVSLTKGWAVRVVAWDVTRGAA